MPELPEVETTRSGIEPHVVGRRVTAVKVHDARLRWPVPADLPATLGGLIIQRVSRRGKYLLFETAGGWLLTHLGMSGSLRIVTGEDPRRKHDHVEILFEQGVTLRFHDPRRFGCMLWLQGDPYEHRLLAKLGPEPLGPAFKGEYLFKRSRGRSAPVKSFLMDAHVVVGVGNIYANEALFRAGIHPRRAAGRISQSRYESLAGHVKAVLGEAIADGGTTLRDFVNSQGSPGYFSQQLSVYGRGGLSCTSCTTPLKEIRLAQRTTVYCPSCQR